MAGKPVFTEEQHEVLHACTLRALRYALKKLGFQSRLSGPK